MAFQVSLKLATDCPPKELVASVNRIGSGSARGCFDPVTFGDPAESRSSSKQSQPTRQDHDAQAEQFLELFKVRRTRGK